MRQICKQMWGIWNDLYIPSLFSRQKWYIPQRPFKIGDFVLYKSHGPFDKLYPVGTIVSLIKGSDGILRNVIIKTEKGKTINVPACDVSLLEGILDEHKHTTHTREHADSCMHCFALKQYT